MFKDADSETRSAREEIRGHHDSGEWWTLPVCSPNGWQLAERMQERLGPRGHTSKLFAFAHADGRPGAVIVQVRKAHLWPEELARLGVDMNAGDSDVLIPSDAPGHVVRAALEAAGIS